MLENCMLRSMWRELETDFIRTAPVLDPTRAVGMGTVPCSIAFLINFIFRFEVTIIHAVKTID